MFEREFFLVSSDKVIFKIKEKKRMFISQIDDFGSFFFHGYTYFCVDEFLLDDPVTDFWNDQIKYKYLKGLNCYKQKTGFRHLNKSYKTMAFLSRFYTELGNDSKLTLVNSHFGKTTNKFWIDLDDRQIKSFEFLGQNAAKAYLKFLTYDILQKVDLSSGNPTVVYRIKRRNLYTQTFCTLYFQEKQRMTFLIQNPKAIHKIIDRNHKFHRKFAKTKITKVKPIDFELQLVPRNGQKMFVDSFDYDHQGNALHLTIYLQKWPVLRDAELRILFDITIDFGNNIVKPSTRTCYSYCLDAVFKFGSKLLLLVDLNDFTLAYQFLCLPDIGFSVLKITRQNLQLEFKSQNLIYLEELTGVPCSVDHVKQAKWHKAVNFYKNQKEYHGLLVMRNDTVPVARHSSTLALSPQPSNCMCFLQCRS